MYIDFTEISLSPGYDNIVPKIHVRGDDGQALSHRQNHVPSAASDRE